MISWRPALGMMSRLVGGATMDPEVVAHEWWRIAEPETRFVPPAILLPGQIERIRICEFGTIEEVILHLRGGFEMTEGATLGFALRDADLVDGVLYTGRARRTLRPDARARPFYAIPEERTSGVLYESWAGNRWFGNWLSDDCLCYALAERFGVPGTSVPASRGHAAEYEARLGQRPRRFSRVRFDELILLNDRANNADRRARATRMRARLLLRIDAPERPGVFILRGETGDRRLLVNEIEIADRLRDEHGFLVIDPTRLDVPAILAACAGARIIAGVEGSQLVHGLMVMAPEATLLTLQPPDRVTSVLKIATDRQGQGFAMLVGQGDKTGFHADWAEVTATLRLIETAPGL
jgi:hypothetical protein